MDFLKMFFNNNSVFIDLIKGEPCDIAHGSMFSYFSYAFLSVKKAAAIFSRKLIK